MAWIVTGIAVVAAAGAKTYKDTTDYNKKKEKEALAKLKAEQEAAKEEARLDILEQEERAREAENFSRSTGRGLGQLGNVSLEVDDDDDESGLSI